MNISFDKVIKVYNGKSGCMCGCNGTYSTTSVAKENGIKEIEHTDVNDRRAKMMINKLVKDARTQVEQHHGGIMCAYIETDTRITAIYFTA